MYDLERTLLMSLPGLVLSGETCCRLVVGNSTLIEHVNVGRMCLRLGSFAYEAAVYGLIDVMTSKTPIVK